MAVKKKKKEEKAEAFSLLLGEPESRGVEGGWEAGWGAGAGTRGPALPRSCPPPPDLSLALTRGPARAARGSGAPFFLAGSQE